MEICHWVSIHRQFVRALHMQRSFLYCIALRFCWYVFNKINNLILKWLNKRVRFWLNWKCLKRSWRKRTLNTTSILSSYFTCKVSLLFWRDYGGSGFQWQNTCSKHKSLCILKLQNRGNIHSPWTLWWFLNHLSSWAEEVVFNYRLFLLDQLKQTNIWLKKNL